MLAEISKIIRSGLNRKLASIVLFSIILVEFILLFPSMMNYKQQQLEILENHAELLISTVDSLIIAGQPIAQASMITQQLNNNPTVLGYAICDERGCTHEFGEVIESSNKQTGIIASVLLADDTRLELTRMLKTNSQQSPYWIVLRTDASMLRQKVTLYLWRTLGLIAIITLFVTLATLVGVAYIIINPVLHLKQTMHLAMQDPTQPKNYLVDTQRDDEIADLAQTYNRLLFDISHYQDQLQESKLEIERGLTASEARWKFALEGSGDVVWDWAPETNDVYLSPQITELLGYEQDGVIFKVKPWTHLIHPDDLEASRAALIAHLKGISKDYSFEHRVAHKNGKWIWVLSRGMVTSRNENHFATRVVGTHTNISPHKETEALIWRQANLDLLTHLPNRRLFQKNLRTAIASANQHGTTMALLFLDLDNFKIINDTDGHQTGDEILIEASNRLRECVSGDDFISRLGGDEFTLITETVEDEAQTSQLAGKICRALAKPFQINHKVFYLSVSIGITYYPQDASSPDMLLMNADQAMYAAKEQGRNRYCHFSQAMRTKAQTRMRIVNELREAVKQAQFEVFYQPIVCFKTGKIVKAEALIRWQHPKHGLLGADSVIRLAEETGMIIDIGDWVFRRSTEQLAIWRERYEPTFKISVNTSPSQYRDDGCVAQDWLDHLKQLGLPYDSLIVEITETMMMNLDAGVIGKLDDFRNAGIQLALDDFGTGYSSLSYLQKINSDFLKIDRSFVSNITENQRNQALCGQLIEIAHIFGMQVIAEGIETTDQAQLLADNGCDFGQGFLYSKPVSASDFGQLLAKQKQS